MSDLHATIRLRPLRVALLVAPTDLSSIRKFMRICACLWGGMYNPIIPVFRIRPREWRSDLPDSLTGAELPEAISSSSNPMFSWRRLPIYLRRSALALCAKYRVFVSLSFRLNDLLAPRRPEALSSLKLGLDIIDVLNRIYECERRFQLRHDRPAILVKEQRRTGLAEGVFGLYPNDEPSSRFARGYSDLFDATVVEATPDTWVKVYKNQAVTPLEITGYQLQRHRSWRDHAKYFVFDPSKATDLIDLWNLRIEPSPVFPIPIDWWPDLVPEVSAHVATEFRPLWGNSLGPMHHTEIEFARSIAKVRQRESLDMLDPTLPPDSFVWHQSRDSVWDHSPRDHAPPPNPVRVIAQEKMLTLAVRDSDPPITEFPALAPDFATEFAGFRPRWVNVVSLAPFRRNDIATVLPLNVINAAWPGLGYHQGRVVVGKEGWSFPQRFIDSTQTVRLHAHADAVIASLKDLGVRASLSDAGRIAKEILQHLGGLQGVDLLADPCTLKLLNEMAAGSRIRARDGIEVEEVFDPRTRSERDWQQHVKRRRGRRPERDLAISDFTDRNVIRLGLSTKCPRCMVSNWSSLTAVDYVITCQRCLEQYPFPQGALQPRGGHWSYRVIGPFSAPDYARGSYGTLLTLNVLQGVSHASACMTYSTALELHLNDGAPCEVDFAAWLLHRLTDHVRDHALVFGETKSFGTGDLIKPRDLAQLRRVAERFPGAVLVISVLREHFTPREVHTLVPFVRWARRLDRNRMPTNPVILLTGVELFHEYDLVRTWRARAGQYERFADYDCTNNLHKLAEATQVIYLGLPLFADDQRVGAE